ncbi:MAG: dihydropteroate synthase [Algoriphagus sp.]|jgi:dihydropteroate synthase|uniref:dihydropteroate synthase n=2 Tax=Algoriphagus sp. TaxID=1872435 RepID=UPI00271C0DE5|nr:dihydropteroate synthase [Algoriphagus sp.]MDO8967580.1 dihydropteroate synthase [Algoriphagus sp.]MDP3198619.1 dihydropteroate synthase [Algoriphagus sp.]
MLSGSNPSSSTEDKLFPQKYTLQIKGRIVCLDKPQVMGILNLTPDSFFTESRVNKNREAILEKAGKMIYEGADFLDLGGYSSRPGAVDISIQEEIDRVVPAVEVIRKEFPDILLSIDTFRSKVAQEAVFAGADIVNDISAGNLDEAMLPMIASLGVPYIAMHMKGNPQNMLSQSNYSDILREILHYFAEKVDLIRKLGIKDVIIDPGIGFAKTIEQNFYLLKNLKSFETLGFPLLVGVSRKSMIYKTLQIDTTNALNGTTALNMFALLQGANILRVHDVKEAKETVKLFERLYP